MFLRFLFYGLIAGFSALLLELLILLLLPQKWSLPIIEGEIPALSLGIFLVLFLMVLIEEIAKLGFLYRCQINSRLSLPLPFRQVDAWSAAFGLGFGGLEALLVFYETAGQGPFLASLVFHPLTVLVYAYVLWKKPGKKYWLPLSFAVVTTLHLAFNVYAVLR